MRAHPLWWRCSAIAVLVSTLTACETMPSNAVTQVLNISSSPQSLDLKTAPDARVWGDAEQEVIDNRATGYGLVSMPVVQKYLDSLLHKVRTEAGVPAWPGKVYVNASSEFNAYTQSSGNIYINIGLLNAIVNEDELIGLLAHEFSHSYLQYDQLKTTVLETDSASDVASVMTLVGQNLRHQDLAANLKQDKAMRSAAAVLMAYQLSRNLLSPAWSRSQEYAADDMAVQLSIRMGYSVQDGWVRVLERMLAHEKKQNEQKDAQRAYLRQSFEAVRDAQFAKLQQGGKADVGGAVVNEVMGNISLMGQDLAGYLTQTHPDTTKRLARVNELNDKLMGETREWPDPRAGEWKKIKETRAVKRLFDGYLNASQAQAVLGTAREGDATKLAKMSLVQETQGHALPAVVGWQTNKQDPAVLRALQANMRSPQHRAWRPYVLYAEYQLEQGKKRDAQRTLDDGFKHFERSPLAWQDYIQLQVQMGNTQKAKELAAQCGKSFKGYQAACDRAADEARLKAANAPVEGKADWGWMERLIQR